MQVRLRKLESTLDREELDAIQRDGSSRVSGNTAVNYVVAVAEAPRQVTAHDFDADLMEAERMLLRGRLAPTDLVNAGDGWQTLAESPLFADACEALEAQASKRRRAIAALIALGIASFVLVVILGGY